MATSPYGSIFDEEPFRDFDLLTGGSPGGQDTWPPGRPGVHRVDIARLFSEAARGLLHRAARFATERGAPDLDVLDLLVAAIEEEPTRTLLREAGADREELAERIAAALPPGDGDGTPPATLSPTAKRAFLDAQRIARALRSSYIGPSTCCSPSPRTRPRPPPGCWRPPARAPTGSARRCSAPGSSPSPAPRRRRAPPPPPSTPTATTSPNGPGRATSTRSSAARTRSSR